MKKLTSLLAIVFCVVSLTSCSDVKNDEFNQTVADKTVSMLNDYYEGMRTRDFDLAFGHYAEFYQDNIQQELEYYGGTEDDYILEKNAVWYTENYGDDINISLEVTSTQEMTNSVIKKYNDLLDNLYLSDDEISKVYNVTVDKTTSGSLKTDTITVQWTILEIDDKLWLYDTYFEDIANAQTSGETQDDMTYVVS